MIVNIIIALLAVWFILNVALPLVLVIIGCLFSGLCSLVDEIKNLIK